MAVEVVVKRVPLVANGVIHKPGASVKIVETLAVALERRGMCEIIRPKPKAETPAPVPAKPKPKPKKATKKKAAAKKKTK